jgi:hypothetical protein
MSSYTYDDIIPPGIDLDLLQHEWPVHSTGIEDLPNELLDMIAEKLLQRDLHSLTVLSKRFFEIAQGLLYSDIVIPDTEHYKTFNDFMYSKRKNRLLLLFTTLTGKPHLARKVNKLLIWPRHIDSEKVDFRMESLPGFRALPAYSGIEVPLKESIVVGILLA